MSSSIAPFVDLPLQVKDGGIYWQKLSSFVAAAAPSEEEGEVEASHPAQPAAGAPGVVEEEICFWHRDRDFPWRVDGHWSDLAHKLLEEEGDSGSEMKIEESALLELVQKLKGDATCAQHVCLISNAKRPKLRAPELTPEMAFQQLLFPPITGLFYCLDPDRYAADSVVRNGNFTYKNNEGAKVVLLEIKPDAAVTFSKKHLVLAMLELKKKGPHKGDMEKCVLMSSVSALALAREGGLAKVTIPMVVNDGELAYLYIVTVQRDNECPVVELILVANMSDASETAEMVATLAVILHKLMQSLNASKVAKRLRLSLDKIPRTSSSNSASKSTRRSSQPRSRLHRSSRDEDTSEQASKRARVDRADQGAAEAGAATVVAACEGQVIHVRHFCVRTRNKESDDDNDRRSPFYFVGVLTSTSVPVFIKVWRGNSDARIRRDVESEIRLLKVAHQHRVPCPKVVDLCTALDVDHGGGREDETYHRLVMHKLPDDPVLRKDVLPFAVSLIEGVLKLHAADIVHCDIKPNNLVWNSSAQRAFLVDFGHAQEIRSAKAYTGTVGYTAPEVVNKSSPHGPVSDAYSVGRTIEHVCNRARYSKEHDVLRDVAEMLSRDDPSSRITLQRALEELHTPSLTNCRPRDQSPTHAQLKISTA